MKTFIALCEQLGRHPSIHDAAWRDLLAGERMPYNAEEQRMALRTFDALAGIGPAVQLESELVLMRKAPRPRPAWRITPRI